MRQSSSTTLGRSRTSSSTLKRKGNLSTDEDTALSDMHKKVKEDGSGGYCACVTVLSLVGGTGGFVRRLYTPTSGLKLGFNYLVQCL